MTTTVFNNITLIGGSGQLGNVFLHAFLASGQFVQVKVFAREESLKEEERKPSFDEIRSRGAEVIGVKYDDHDALVSALKGTDVIVCTLSQGFWEIQKALIDAAIVAGVKRFVPTEYGMDVDAAIEVAWLQDRRRIREYLRSLSGEIEHTFFPCGYLTNYAISSWLGFDVENRQTTYYGTGNEKISMVATPDLAKYIVASLKSDGAAGKNRVVRAVGDVKTPKEIVGLLEKLIGVKFETTTIPLEEVREQAKQNSYMTFSLALAQGRAYVGEPDSELVGIVQPQDAWVYIESTFGKP